jgi:hypothetical protein
MEDLWKSTTEVIRERVSSPVLLPLAVSWAGWNYKFLLVLASSVGVPRVFELAWSTAYPSGWVSFWLFAALGPLCTAGALIFWLPLAEHWVLKRTLPRQRQLIELRREHANATPLTREESRLLRADFERERQEATEQLKKAGGALDASQLEVQDLQRNLAQTNAEVKTNPFHLSPAEKEVLSFIAGTVGILSEADATRFSVSFDSMASDSWKSGPWKGHGYSNTTSPDLGTRALQGRPFSTETIQEHLPFETALPRALEASSLKLAVTRTHFDNGRLRQLPDLTTDPALHGKSSLGQKFYGRCPWRPRLTSVVGSTTA